MARQGVLFLSFLYRDDRKAIVDRLLFLLSLSFFLYEHKHSLTIEIVLVIKKKERVEKKWIPEGKIEEELHFHSLSFISINKRRNERRQ